jgi:glycosyltransferase involved in cell wall biosynthesis
LIAAQISPPSQIVAARRVAGLAKYLADRGHHVEVLTSIRSGRGAVAGAAATWRTHDLAATSLNWRRPRISTPVTPMPSGPISGVEAHAVPDVALATWLPFAVPRALALVRSGRFDCVVTTSPPTSTHLLGALMHRLGAHWIADLRDGWVSEPPRPPWPLAWEARLDSLLERVTLTRADAVTAVTRPIAEDLQTRLGVECRLIPNGFDPDERVLPDDAMGEVSQPGDELLDPGRHSLVHTGRATMSERSPTVVFDALRLLRNDRPEIAQRLEVVFAGPPTADETSQLADPAVRGLARSVGLLDRERALALQRAADSLLVLAGGPRERTLATGKLFEYLTAGPPILVVGEHSEAARIVQETGTGFAVAADSPAAVAEGLSRILAPRPAAPRSEAIERYSWRTLAGQVGAVVQSVCAPATPRSRDQHG